MGCCWCANATPDIKIYNWARRSGVLRTRWTMHEHICEDFSRVIPPFLQISLFCVVVHFESI